MSNEYTNNSFERGSRISHSYIINDEEVKQYLNNCEIPVKEEDVELNDALKYDIIYPEKNTIEFIVAVDGESTTIPVKKSFPSSLITFFQFGSLLIKGSDLDEMEKKPFVSPSDINKLKKIEREKFVLPTKNVALKKDIDFRTTVREAIHEFFKKKHSGTTSILETLYWFIFEQYNPSSTKSNYKLSQCPHCGTNNIVLEKDKIEFKNYSWTCTHDKCNKEIFITDVFRLFEKVDNDAGASGIITYLESVTGSFFIIHTIKSLMEIEDGLVDRFLLVKDGPLSFGGETANMHKPMQVLLTYLNKNNKINLIGVETSGAFVDHARQIKDKLNPGQVFLLNNEHIYTYIQVGNHKEQQYGSTSYYSGKFIYKAFDGRVYVLTIPVENHNTYYNQPELADLKNIQEILMNIDKLRCDIYENALIPVAIANKLISLTNHPSYNILERFAKKTMGI
ncbi:hypothetical protein ASE92_11820 [Pedobacter sp. Leaf41]|uniref:hypothetical protein n=1 Tax=Pedobacter sp. Leaf41 TaxID=1736218 RepID=UPI000703535A|nr:hypothetical protein [Pedobacter sp. Leaf41]KQN34292.1 hypothetical protein ASE92_11820 [Pedobacter sp. Leaf41]